NINFPDAPPQAWKGPRATCLGRAEYDNVFEARLDPRGRKYFWQAGTLKQVEDEDTDLYAVRQGYISITPLHSDLTDYQRLERLKESLF
ncbi:MAG: 5'/3'-nucleotidase SurE, partial [Peptococcaceae bacterium]|nr:5'/3'-nucleotidase SurE [Peptococcaceae bacterium]